MTEELVTLDTAKLLKEKGFDWKCEHLIGRNKVIQNITFRKVCRVVRK